MAQRRGLVASAGCDNMTQRKCFLLLQAGATCHKEEGFLLLQAGSTCHKEEGFLLLQDVATWHKE